MKRIFALFCVIASGCYADQPVQSSLSGKSLELDGPIVYRQPNVYISDDTPAVKPTMCFIMQNADDIVIGHVISTSEVVVPRVQCGSTKLEIQTEIQQPHQVVELESLSGERYSVIAWIWDQTHNDLVPGQQVIMGVINFEGRFFLNEYFLIDNADGNLDSPQEMPATISELKLAAELRNCGPRVVSAESAAQFMFSPPNGSCNSPDYSEAEIVDGL